MEYFLQRRNRTLRVFLAEYAQQEMQIANGKWQSGVQLLTDVEYPVVGFVRIQP